MDKEKAYFVLVSEKPSVHGKPGAIVEQTLKLAASGLAKSCHPHGPAEKNRKKLS